MNDGKEIPANCKGVPELEVQWLFLQNKKFTLSLMEKHGMITEAHFLCAAHCDQIPVKELSKYPACCQSRRCLYNKAQNNMITRLLGKPVVTADQIFCSIEEYKVFLYWRDEQSKYMDTAEAANILGLSSRQVNRLVTGRNGKINADELYSIALKRLEYLKAEMARLENAINIIEIRNK